MIVYRQKPWVVMTSKGQVYIVMAHTGEWAQTRFQSEFPALVIASIVQAEEVL